MIQSPIECPFYHAPAIGKSMSETTNRNSIEQEVERNFKHNFLFNSLDGASYWFGYSFISPAIILPVFLNHFTGNPILIGMLAFMNTTFFLVPQLFTSNWVRNRPVKKYFPVTLGFLLERVPVMFFPFITLLFAKSQPNLTLSLTLFVYGWYCLGAGLILVGWQDMIAKVIPVDRRGRFFGITNFSGTATGILGAMSVAWVLANFEFPYGYVTAFAAAAVFIFLSWVFLAQTREPAVPNTQPPVSQAAYFRSLPEILRRDTNFSRYLWSQIVISIAGMAVSFLAVYPAQHWNLPDSDAGNFTVAMLVGQALANLLFGVLSDRKGHKLILEIGVFASIISFILSVVAPSPLWFYAVFFARGISMASVLMSGISLPLEFSSADDRPTYIGLANTIPGVASGIAPLIGGWLASLYGYPFVFGLSAAVGVFGFVLLRYTVREPRFHSANTQQAAGQSTL